MPIKPEHLDELLAGYEKPEDLLGEAGDQWLRGVSVDDALKMQKPAPDDAIVIRPTEKKAA
jgi:hypothetical protein